jgi:hypothetical protein
MRKIVLATIGLALFATPAAASSHSAFDRTDRPQTYTLERNSPSTQARASGQFFVAPVGTRSFGLTLGNTHGNPHHVRPHFAPPHSHIERLRRARSPQS